jgi:hypothetical protein
MRGYLLHALYELSTRGRPEKLLDASGEQCVWRFDSGSTSPLRTSVRDRRPVKKAGVFVSRCLLLRFMKCK